MTDKHDKLVEAAKAAGFCYVGGTLFAHDIDLTPKLAAFAAAHVASLCADVEPVAWIWKYANGEEEVVFVDSARVQWDPDTHDIPTKVTPLYPASTVASLTAQRDAALARATDWKRLYDRAINEANGLTNYVEDRPELRSAERRLDVIYADARALKGQP